MFVFVFNEISFYISCFLFPYSIIVLFLLCATNYGEIKVFKGGRNQAHTSGPMPNVMAALPNIGDALCSTPQSLADAHY